MADSPLNTLGSRLRYARDLSGLGSRELGRLAGVSEGYPSLVESGARKNVPADALSGFARVLGVSLDWLVDGHGEPPTSAAIATATDSARASWGVGHPPKEAPAEAAPTFLDPPASTGTHGVG